MKNWKLWLAKPQMVKILPIAGLLAIHLLFGLGRKMDLSFWVNQLLMVVGWGLGIFVAGGDNWFYLLICDTANEACSRARVEMGRFNWREAAKILKLSEGERKRLPIKNILTGMVMAGVGLWIITSSPSFLGGGLVLGLETTLFLELLRERDYKKWYWVFERDFSEVEHRGLVIAWGIMLLIQWLVMIGR